MTSGPDVESPDACRHEQLMRPLTHSIASPTALCRIPSALKNVESIAHRALQSARAPYCSRRASSRSSSCSMRCITSLLIAPVLRSSMMARLSTRWRRRNIRSRVCESDS